MAAVNDRVAQLVQQLQQFKECLSEWSPIVAKNCGKEEALIISLGVLLGANGRHQFVDLLINNCSDANKENSFLLQFIQNVLNPHVLKRASDCEAGPPSPEKKEKQTNNMYVTWYEDFYKEKPSDSLLRLFELGVTFLLSMSIKQFTLVFKDQIKATAFHNHLRSGNETSSNAPLCSDGSVLSTKAFAIEYNDPNCVVADFKKYVAKCELAYCPLTYMAPYVSLCQSSGYGKSRLLKQLATQEGVRLLYLAIGDSQQSYPVQNMCAKSTLFLPKQNTENERLIHLQKKLCRCFDLCVNGRLPHDQFDSIDDIFWEEVASDAPLTTGSTVGQEGQNGTLWIAFDEARTLLQESDNNNNNNSVNDFRLLRRALKQIRIERRNIFAILVDTKSQIANFSPNQKLDASYRPQGSLLFHPYILVATHDSLIKKDEQIKFNDEESYLACGRPLWKALSKGASVSGIMEYAKKKILKATTIDVKDDSAMLALVLCRCGVFLSPQSSRATDLAANYMATILLSDCTHERFLVTYFSDPVLSIAASSLWYHTGAHTVLELYILPALRRELTQGAVIEGYLGELVGQILLLIGIDTCQPPKTGYDGKWCSLLDFMRHCFEVKLDAEEYKKAYVGFSHFIPSKVSPNTLYDLKELLRRRGASCLPSCHPGADLLIPFWFQDGGEVTVSYILIQIKNRKRAVTKKTVCEKLRPCNVFPEGSELRNCASIIRILLEIGPVGEESIVEFYDDDKSKIYCMRGLDYPFLRDNKSLQTELRSLLKGTLDVDEWIENDEKYNDQLQLAVNHDTRKELLQKIGFLPKE